MLPHTHDLDIRSAVYTLCNALVAKLVLRDADLVKEELETLGELAKDKDAVIAHLPEVTPAEGK